MKRLALLLVALALLAFSSCAATLRVTATAPAQDNDGTCTAPVLSASPAGAARVVHLAWTGPSTGEDSVTTTAGSPVTYSASVRPGTYSVRVWASGAGGIGCDTTVTALVTAPPWKVSVR